MTTPPPRYAVALIRCAALEWISATLTGERLLWRICSPGRGQWGTLYATRERAAVLAEAVAAELQVTRSRWPVVVEVREIRERWPQDWPEGRTPLEEV